MRRPAPRPVSATRRSSGDTAAILVRAAGKDLGAITQMGSEADDTLAGNFVNRPAFADYVEPFRDLGRAVESGDAAAIAAARRPLDDAGLEVWHSVHDMRIDEAGSLIILAGRARFRPNGAFLMMRTGGL